jgi:hypothetical protein
MLNRGVKVTLTENNANTVVTSKTGLFALLSNPLSTEGSGASRTGRRACVFSARRAERTFHPFSRLKCCVPALLCAVVGALAFTAAPALAATPPETPEVTVEDTTAVVATPSTEATLHGVLDPNIASGTTSEVLDYEFVYRESKTACKGAGEVKTVPQGMSLGMGREEPSQQITGLKPGTEYTVCLLAHNSANPSEETPSAPVTFTTPITPEKPITESPEKVGGNTATLLGELNPGSDAKNGYHFAYNTNGECTGGPTSEPGTEVKATKRRVSTAVTGLEPLREYTVCVVSTNAAGEEKLGNAIKFNTPAAPPIVDSENASNITASEATLEGSVNPNNQFTECHFQYGSSSVTENELACSPEQLKDTYGEQSVSPTKTEVVEGGIVTVPAPVGVSSGSTYKYRIVTKNGKGEESQGPEKTFDTFEAPEPQPASAITPTTTTFNGIIDPHHGTEAGSYEFLYRESAAECQLAPAEAAQAEKEAIEVREQEKPYVLTFPQKRAPEPSAATTGGSPQHVSAEATGLHPGATYSYCLVLLNADGKRAAIGSPVTFTAASAAPVIESASSSNETAETAELHATIDPDGAATSYRFEYDTAPYEEGEAAHGASTPVGEIPAGAGAVPISAEISGLHENKEYHWRLVATNAEGTATSVDHTFFYSTTTTSELPDHRAYEMVTPPFKNGSLTLFPLFNPIGPTVAASGSAVTTMAVQCYAGSESCTALRSSVGEPFEFRRTPGGWVTVPLAPPASEFSENSVWATGAEGPTLFSMPVGAQGEDEWYKREESGSFTAIGPLTPPGVSGILTVHNGGEGLATTDLSHLVWNPTAANGGKWPFDDTLGDANTVYEYVGTRNKEPFLVGVTGGEGSRDLVSECGTTLDTLSADGRTVYFSTCGGLYARVDGETPEAHTIRITEGGSFVGATENGHTVFFREGEGLYESVCTAHCEGSGEQETGEAREAIDVSVGSAKPEVQGVTAISADGSHIYFVANGVLASGATHGTCHPAGSEAEEAALRCNLYVYERDASYPKGHIAFIASLPGIDKGENWNSNAGTVNNSLANVTPDGSFLVFQSNGDLTPDAHAGAGQVYRYDAETGQLVRVSIGNDGFDDDGNAAAAPATIVPSRADAEELPGSHPGPLRDDPTMSDDGEYVFFESPAALAPHALNDVVVNHTSIKFGSHPVYAVNVYEWHEGHVYLISDGRDVTDVKTPCEGRSAKSSSWEVPSETESATCLLGSDASGHNAFFMTADSLVPKDTDTQVDIYDARVCEPENGNPCIAEPAPPLPPCNEEACHGIPAATPSLLAPGTATFNGEGNVSPPPHAKPAVKKKTVKCKHGDVKNKKGRCVKKPKKKTKKVTGKPSNNRRTGR